MKTYKREDAIAKSTEYFNGDSLAAEVFVNKYALRNEKLELLEDTPDKMHQRMAKEFARIEKKYPNPLSYEEIYGMFENFGEIVAQGSPSFGIGNPYQYTSVSNCFVIKTTDSYGGICNTDEQIAQISKRRGGCVEENSFVEIKNKGIVKIKDINIGDEILSYNIITRKSEYKEVLDKYYTDVQKKNQIKIKLQNGFEIRTSRTHPILILKDGEYNYIQAGDIKEGDICIVPENNDISNIYRWGHFTKELEDLGWFIGAHTGDGTLGYINKPWDKSLPKGLRLRILGDNENIIKEFARICNVLTSSHAQYRVVTRKNYKTKCWEYLNNTNALFDIADHYFDGKIGKKCYDCHVFSFIEKNNLWMPYIAGLIDTDGHIRKDGKIDISMCAKDIIYKLSSVLSSAGFKIHISARSPKRINENPIYRLVITDDKFYNLIIPFLRHDKKKQRLILKVENKRKYSHTYCITRKEEDEIMKIYGSRRYKRDVVKDKSHKNMMAIISLIKKHHKIGLGGLLVFRDHNLISNDKVLEILQRKNVELVLEDQEDCQYIDISVKDNNNYYAGSSGLINIHNCGLDISPIRPKGMLTKNSAFTTDGITIFMSRFSNTTREVAQCIAAGQRVLTESGLKNIEDIEPLTDRVWTKCGWVKVNGKINNEKMVYKITTIDGFEIRASADHVFLAYDGKNIEEKKLSDFEEGDTILLLAGVYKGKNKEYKSFCQYEYKNSNNKPNNCKLPLFLNEDIAYLLGYSYGDGYVERNKYGEPRDLSLACGHKYPEIENKLSKIISDNFGYHPRSRLGGGAVNRLDIRNKCVIDFFHKNGVLKNKADVIYMPELILESPDSVISAFIAGYFDADGYASGKKKGYSFSSISKKFLQSVQSLMMSMGIISKIRCESRSHLGWQDLYTLSVLGAYSKNLFKEIIHHSIKVSQLQHDGKRDNRLTPFRGIDFKTSHSQYDFIPDNTQNISVYAYERLRQNGHLVPEGMLVQTNIDSIDEDGDADTYDLQLEKENMFWCEGFYVHNSGRRGALMLSISVHHPEIMSFITSKRDLQKITGANISVRITDEFMNAVKKDKLYELRWPVDSSSPSVSKKVKAKEVWDALVESNYLSAEPGILFWDTIIRNSPADIYSELGLKTLSTNPSLRGGTMVLTDKGVHPIKWLAENRSTCRVLNINGIWCDCNVFKSGDNKPLYKINFTNGQSVFCTKEHKWPILNTNGNIINRHTGEICKKKTIDLKPRDKIYLPSFSNPINNPHCKFTRMDGFVLGWNQGDGWISRHIGANNVLQYGFIFGEEDMKSGIANNIMDYTNALAERESSLRRDHNTNSYSYVTTDRRVREKMAEMKASHKEDGVPYSVWEGNDEFVKGYVDGLFSSDGYIECKEKLSGCRMILVSSHKKLIEDVQKLLLFYGIRSGIRKSESTSRFPKYNSDKKYTRYDLHIGTIHVQKFSNVFSLSNCNKQKKLDEIRAKSPVFYEKSKRIEFANSREYMVIKNVELTSFREDVYDIHVHDDTHTFMTEAGITGNCGELPLADKTSCILLCLNVASFVNNPFSDKAEFDQYRFVDRVRKAQRLIDDLVDIELECIGKIISKIESDPEPEDIKHNELSLWKGIEEKCRQSRRTGLGITGLGDCIAELNVKYGSPESEKIVDNIYKTLRDEAYRSSIGLAKERGAFPLFDPKLEQESKNEYLERLPDDIKNSMWKYGRRNISILTTAPAGSISTQTQTTSGFEPVYLAQYVRKRKLVEGDKETPDFIDDSGDKWKEYTVDHHGLKKFKEITGKTFEDSPYFGAESVKIDFDARVRMQGIATQYVDHAISSTVNLPNDVTKETISKLYFKAWESGCKGLTIYRDGSRDGVLTAKKSNSTKDCEDCDEASKMLVELVSKGKRPKYIIPSSAPKRLDVIPCDIQRSKVGGSDWLFFIGTLSGVPYEVFGGEASQFTIPQKYKTGWIVKNGKIDGVTQYNLVLGSLDDVNEKLEFKGIVRHFNNNEYGAFTRLTSLALRHGIPIKYIIEQITKKGVEGDLFSFQRAMARVLKKYIGEGEKCQMECPDCYSHDMVYRNGCPTCMQCGFSHCS